MKAVLSAFRFLVFSNIYVSLCAMTFTAKTALLLYGNNGDIKVNLLVFFATLFLYCFHRIYHRGKMIPQERNEDRHHWADQHKYVFYGLTVVSFTAAAVLMLYMPIRVWFILVPVAVLGLGYSIPFIPSKNGLKRLRDLSWLKAVWIGIAYGWITTFLPVVFTSGSKAILNPDVLLVFARSSLFVFVLVIPFDIRDMAHDAVNKVKSIPVLLGADKAIKIALWTLGVMLLIVILQYKFYTLSVAVVIALLLSITETAIVVPLSRSDRPDLFYPLAIETSMIFHWFVIWLAVMYL